MESDREAKVLTALSHPNIAQIYGVEEGRWCWSWSKASRSVVLSRSKRRSTMHARSALRSKRRTKRASPMAT